MKDDYSLSMVPKLIYVMRINDKSHKGCLKVGDATVEGSDLDNNDIFRPNSNILNQAARKRINGYTQTAGIAYELLYTEITLHLKGNRFIGFRDHDVHEVLERSGIKKKFFSPEINADEWYITDLETVKHAITAVKKGRTSLHASEITKDQSPISFRPEQKDAIDKTVKHFKKSNQMLWNAKMRFGKTLTALQVVKEFEFTRTLILTHRPAVNDGWFEDFNKIFYDRKDYAYGSKTKGETFTKLEKSVQKGMHYVYFASMQDLRGSEIAGGKFDKNNELFSAQWDLIINDEAHEGTQTELGKNVLNELLKDHTKFIQLSGTPFNLLNEYQEEAIYTWDYVMEQKAKADWFINHPGDPNPYEALPRINIFTFDIGKHFADYADDEVAFNFHEFFRVGENGDFIHKKDIAAFLNLICKEDEKSNYPYATRRNRANFRHSLWRIPGVKEAKALSTMLQKHPVFGQFQIVNVAGEGDDDAESDAALNLVNDAIGSNPEETYTITLSCGRLTTGVSVPAWTAVFMLAGSYNTSASSYMQTIFRCQTPATINGKVKTECFVFDFAPDRTLKMIAETAKISSKAGKTTGDDRKAVGDFLNFCPVISMSGTKMSPYKVDQMLEQLKKVYVERVIRNGFEDGYLYNNDELMKLDKVQLEEFDSLRAIIGQTKAMPKSGDIDINNQGFTNEQYDDLEEAESKKRKKQDLTPEEKKLLEEKKEKKKNRDTAISILRGISIRMPLMLYGAELSDEEQEITIDNFTDLIDPQSWEEFMPNGVSKQKFNAFKKYYEPDVFRAAGKRIRAMARAADSLPIEERIERITAIFNTFRNPDKETVLTPWRVVNMHLSDSLGGYTFYDESFEKQLAEPRYVNQGQVTSEVFGASSKVLEINSKSGLYPLYAAYSIYQSRLCSENLSGAKLSLSDKQKIWDKVLAENLFVVCKTPMAKSITRRTLLGFRPGKINAHHFENLTNTLKYKPQQFIDRITRPKCWGMKGHTEMKFDAIVGNPPYQVMAAGDANGSDPIYHLFIDAGRAICNRGTFIHPGRFLFNAGKTPKDWNDKMLNDEHYKVVRYWANSNDVFSTVDIKGGVAVTYWDEKAKFKKIGVFTAYPELRSIIDKVVTEDFDSFSKLVYSRTVYRLTDKLYQENPWADGRQSKGHKYDVGSNVLTVFPELFTDEEEFDKHAKIYGLIKNKRVYKWFNREYLSAPDNFDFYKVFIPKANGSGAIGEVLSTPVVGLPVVGLPVVGHTESFLSIGKFETEAEATACLKYIKGKFARTMLGTLKVTQDNPRETWANVPMQDFTSASDIDWTVSIPEIDQQLYAKYGLSDDEINFIESAIKPME